MQPSRMDDVIVLVCFLGLRLCGAAGRIVGCSDLAKGLTRGCCVEGGLLCLGGGSVQTATLWLPFSRSTSFLSRSNGVVMRKGIVSDPLAKV